MRLVSDFSHLLSMYAGFSELNTRSDKYIPTKMKKRLGMGAFGHVYVPSLSMCVSYLGMEYIRQKGSSRALWS